MARRSRAFESIFFQLDSDLGRGLEQAFAEAINYTNTIDYTGVSEDKWTQHRYTYVHSYAKSTLFPQIASVIQKTTNIIVTKIVDARTFCGMFAVDISLDDVEAVTEIFEHQTGTTTGGDVLSDSAKEIAETSKLLDKKLSRFTSNVFGRGKRRIRATLYMDVDMAFLMKDNMPNHLVEDFTARELAAIYLHEVGHLVTMLEQAGNMYQTFALEKKHLESAIVASKRQNPSLSKMINTYKTNLRPIFEEHVKKGRLNKEYLKATDALCAASEYAEHTQRSDIFYGIFERLCSVLVSMWFAVVLFFARIGIYVYLYLIGSALTYFISDKPGESGKSTEYSTSNSVYYHAERMADEFATRHGYGADLASALAKLTNIGRYLSATAGLTYSSGSVRNSYVYSLYIKGFTALVEFFRIDMNSISNDFSGPGHYEDDLARLDRILMDQRVIFKKDLPADIAGHYLAEMEKTRKAINAIRKPVTSRISDTLWKYILDYPAVLKRLCQLDDMEEMEEHLKRIRKLIDNELYASAAAFKTLAR